MSQLWHRKSTLEELNVQVRIVTFDANYMAKAYIEDMKITWPLLLDSDLTLYNAYGMKRASFWDLYGAAATWKYVKLVLSGQWPGRPGKDLRQLGGDVLIDPHGLVRLHFVSTGPHDRPSIDSLIETIKSS